MENSLRLSFIQCLENIYGDYKYESALFGSSNYSKIAKDLCYSNSHFTKLMSGGATNAMYERALRNVNRLSEIERLQSHQSQKEITEAGKRKIYLVGLGLLTCLSVFLLYKTYNTDIKKSDRLNQYHPLDMYFDFSTSSYYKSPYLTDSQVNNFCPASAYEGKWGLTNHYIIPIPYKIPGLYYVGKSADIRLKAKQKSDQFAKGAELIGFENIQNEIWFDKTMSTIDTDQFSASNNGKTGSTFDFHNNDSFVKIANVHSCFFDEIRITKDAIFRSGEPCGRYANSTNDDILKEYQLDLDHIFEYIIGNMVFAQCDPLINPYCDPNQLTNTQSTLDFACVCYTTENTGIKRTFPYTKSIKLLEQNYQSELLCTCD